MRLTRQHTARSWRVTWAESKKQPFTPWVPDPDRDHPTRKTHRGSPGRSAVHGTQTIRWTLRRRQSQKENKTPSISAGTAPAARTGPCPAAAAQAIAATARRRGVVARTAMSPARTPAATTTMRQPPSNPTRTRGTPTTPGWPWPTTPTLPRPGAPRPTPTASSRTSVGIRGTGNPGHGGAQRGHP